jgi:hypothetical protein
MLGKLLNSNVVDNTFAFPSIVAILTKHNGYFPQEVNSSRKLSAHVRKRKLSAHKKHAELDVATSGDFSLVWEALINIVL